MRVRRRVELLAASLLAVSVGAEAQSVPAKDVANPAPTQPPDRSRPAPNENVATPSPQEASAVESRWRATLYGFVEVDAMHDTTQSYGPAANNTVLARPGRPDNYAWAHGRTQLTANNSLIGVKADTTEFRPTRASAQVEIDFFGGQPTDATEQSIFTTPAVRMRLFYLRLETPIVDVLAGQYHDLFAWGGEGFYPNTVAFLGVGGEIYHRSPQVRISKTLDSGAFKVSIAVAAVRPVQRDSEVPDFQGGIKLAVDGWKGAAAPGFGQPELIPLSLGLSGVWRRFAVAEFVTVPGNPKIGHGWGFAANALLPIIPPRSADNRSNSLSLTAEFSIGTGISDLYAGLTGGALFPVLPDPSGSILPPPIYRANIDSGIVTFDANGNLAPIDWHAFVAGLQYFLPIDGGRVWVSATYSLLKSPNLLDLTPQGGRGGIFTQQEYMDANLFFAIARSMHVGLSYQFTRQTFGDLPFERAPPATAEHPKQSNHRGELGFRLFF